MENNLLKQKVRTTKPVGETKSSLVEKEVDMGFFDNFIFVDNEKKYFQNGCQRIHHCSCDCNRCSGVIG